MIWNTGHEKQGAAMHGKVLEFWFTEAGPRYWFTRDAAFDAKIKSRFADLYEDAANGRLDGWADRPDSALALVILLDQFSRNLFRKSPRAYAMDQRALGVARKAVERGFDRDMPSERRRFFYMPFMHSEDLAAQKRCIELFREMGDAEQSLEYAHAHMKIIERFGRFPYRNKTLGRRNTPEEESWLNSSERVSF